ncbi:MAG TPA: hypothetical protein VGR91_09920 [Stellaceae bacterium]|nr:hypothetical protein [Stellaceae bacterium]
MNQTRAADDFATIRARLDELRRERMEAEALAKDPRSERARFLDGRLGEAERRRREKSEGWPPPWAPTIFAKKPRA